MTLPYTFNMRKLVWSTIFVVTAASCAVGQQPASPTASASGPSWERLEALPSGAAIHVAAKNNGGNCMFKSAEADSLTCVTNDGSQTKVFRRPDIKAVQIRRRGRSALLGLAIGAGGGAVIGAPLGRSGSFVGHGAAAVIFAVPGAVIGTIVGATTDFAHSTVYRNH